jgi:hypothetical protein
MSGILLLAVLHTAFHPHAAFPLAFSVLTHKYGEWLSDEAIEIGVDSGFFFALYVLLYEKGKMRQERCLCALCSIKNFNCILSFEYGMVRN